MTQWTAEGGVIGYRAGRAQARGASVGLRPALMWLVLAGSLAWLGALLVPYQSYTSAALLIAVVLLPAVAIWVVTNAGVNGGGALAAMGLLVVLLSDWTVRGGADRDLDLQSVTKFAIWASGVILLIWRSSIVVQTARHLPSISLLAFGVWAVFSAAYSVSPLYSAAAGVAFIGIWMISTTLAVTASERLGLLVITLALLSGMVISLLLYLAFPDRVMVPMEGGTVLRLAGIFGSPNGMGRAAALALLTSLMLCYLLPRSRAALLMLMALTLSAASLYLSGSRASSLALLLGTAVVLLHRRPWLVTTAVACAVCMALVLLFSPDLRVELAGLISRSGRISELATFSGRTQIWTYVLQKIADQPLIGYGFASTREVIPEGYFTMWGWTTTSAHNLWLQVWITTGLVGLVLIVLSQLAWLYEFARKANPVRDGLMVFTVTIGLFEAGPMGPSVNALTMVMMWALALGFRPRSV